MTEPAENGADARAAAPEDPGRVLVVDDSRMNRLTLRRLLADRGYDVVEAEDGRQALDTLGADAGGVDVVLLDLVMPELDGFETLAAIKRDPALAHVPVIVVSGLDDLDGIVRCIEMGATDYLPRPIKPTLLRARVATSLADKRLRDDNARLLATVERQRGELARFLSPQVAALVSSPDGEQLLAGHRRPVTSMFCDFRGFTAFCERAEPEEIMAVMAEYHAAVGRRVTEYDGTLEHFEGDGLHIFYNDPIPQADHVLRAVQMAVALRDDMAALCETWATRGHDLGFGVGIAVGDATAGRVGFEGRYDYAAIGSVVNVAARLSGQAKAGQILVSQRAYAELDGAVEAEAVEGLQLKGISHPVTAYSILRLAGGDAREVPPLAIDGRAAAATRPDGTRRGAAAG